jgi:Ca2+-binding RTX toxin-like protein
MSTNTENGRESEVLAASAAAAGSEFTSEAGAAEGSVAYESGESAETPDDESLLDAEDADLLDGNGPDVARMSSETPTDDTTDDTPEMQFSAKGSGGLPDADEDQPDTAEDDDMAASADSTGESGDDAAAQDSDPAVLTGTDGDDQLDAVGFDKVFGGAGDDTILGSNDDDYLDGGAGNDTIFGYDGDDTIVGGPGLDKLYGGDGDDSFVLTEDWGIDLIWGDETGEDFGDKVAASHVSGAQYVVYYGNEAGSLHAADINRATFEEIEVVVTGDGNDIIDASNTDNGIFVFTGAGNDIIVGGDGDDLLLGDLGADTIMGGLGNDHIDLGSRDGAFGDGDRDVVVFRAGHGHDIIDNFELPVDNGDGTFTLIDRIDLTGYFNADGSPVTVSQLIVSDDGGMARIDFPGGDSLTFIGVPSSAMTTQILTIITSGPSAGYVDGTNGSETLEFPYTDPQGDQIDGTDGDNDVIFGYRGDDVIRAGAGNDTVFGGGGDDTIFGGAGSNLLFGGAGADSFHARGGDTVHGGQGVDTLFISTPATIGSIVITGSVLNPDGSTGNDGYVTFTDGAPRLYFTSIENIVPCFTPGTMIATPRGAQAVETIKAGDKILTRDNGVQEVRWAGAKTLGWSQLAQAPHLRPIRIKAGALGNGLPERDMLVSPQHRVLLSEARAQLYFGETEVLVPAKHLVGRAGFEDTIVENVTYLHFMCDRHEVVLSDGAWTESFQPGDYSLAGLDERQRAEIFAIFPELSSVRGRQAYGAARMTLHGREAALMR